MDDQVNFEPSKSIQSGMFSLKGKWNPLPRRYRVPCLPPCAEQQSGADVQQHIDC
jgi:hypothetical protein